MLDRFHDLINKLHVGVVVQGPSTEVLVCNPASLELLGLDEDQYRGKTSFDPEWNIIKEDGTPFAADERPMARVIGTGAAVKNVVMGVFRPKTRDRIWLMVHAEPQFDADGRIVQIVATLFDITERRELESARRQSRNLESVGRLAGGVAHDFNNLLAVITSATSLALSSLPDDSEVREELLMTLEAANRAAALTRQLLTFARQRPTTPTVADVRALVHAAAPLLARVLGAHIQLELDCAPDTWPTRVDASEIEQVLLNLVANARDAMPAGGTVRIATSNIDEHASRARLPEGEYVCIAVSDSGEGMSDETLEHVFDPFFTTKGVTGGTGLGLATVHGIVRRSGGYIVVESAPGEGATFRIFLPRFFETEARVATWSTANVPPRPAGRTETILLVEDESALRLLSAKVLRDLGYRVLTATDGADALAVARAHEGPIDLLFTDVVMPKMNGTTLAHALTQERPGIGVLLTSGFADASEDRWPLLDKPYGPAELGTRIRAALDAAAAASGTAGSDAL